MRGWRHFNDLNRQGNIGEDFMKFQSQKGYPFGSLEIPYSLMPI